MTDPTVSSRIEAHVSGIAFVVVIGRGHEMITELRGRIENCWDAALAEFSSRELTVATAVIDRLRAMFDDLDGQAASRL
jgi:hypothetical protein